MICYREDIFINFCLLFLFLGDEEERKSFRSKGIPVIFQDELDEKPEIGNKSPVILKDEKPPLLPPLYTSTNPDGKFFFLICLQSGST